MRINNPLINTRESGYIIRKTADLLTLLQNKREEQRVMANKSTFFQPLETQRVVSGLDFSSEIKPTSEQAKAIQDLLEKSTREFNHLPRTLGRFAATGAPVMFKQAPKAAADQSLDETPRKTPRLK